MAEHVIIRGMPQTLRALRALPPELGSKGGGPVRGALFAGAKLIRDAAELKAPRKSGNLQANVYIWRDKDPQSRGATERYTIGVRTRRLAKAAKRAYGKGVLSKVIRTLAGGDAWYWHFVEFGTKKQRAQPFLRPAFEENKHLVVAKFQTELAKAVRAAVLRARQKGGA